MSGNSGPGFGKDPLTPCHGDSLVDQSFQSLKSKEIRDSMSPTHDMKFHSLSLNHPNTTGWDVQTSSEVSPDGRAYRTETVAKTDGVEKINGGLAEFKGKNEQRSSASHQGDDKNFVKKASESANTHLQEKVVIGDENNGRTEMKMSSTTSSSTSQVISSSSTTDMDGQNTQNNRYLMDNTNRDHYEQQQQQQEQRERLQQEKFHQQHRLQTEQNRRDQSTSQQSQQQYSEEYKHNQQESSSRNVETQQLQEQSKRIINVDKASPEYQQHVQLLMSQPGEIISNTVEYPKPNVKMITTVKRLPDGTIVKNKRYETEELRPANENIQRRSTTSTDQSNTQHKSERRVQDEENLSSRLQKTRDAVDNIENVRHINKDTNLIKSHPSDQHTEDISNISSSFSSVKKSSRRFSTETTSETVEEYDDHSHPSNTRGRLPSGAPHTPQDFSTHGFPSVRPNKQTQEYPTDRPHPVRFTDVNTNTTRDGDVITVSSESRRSVKQNSNTERVIETEVVQDGDYPTSSPHGFPSINESSPQRQGTPSRDYPNSPRRLAPTEEFSTNGFPSVRSPTKNAPTYGSPSTTSKTNPNTTDEGVITISSETRRSSKQNSNTERIIETEITDDTLYPERKPDDFSTHGFPSVRESSPRHGTPSRDYPSSPNSAQLHETAGRSPTKSKPDYSTQGFPSARDSTKLTNKPTQISPQYKSEPRSSTTTKSVTTETTKKLLQKEKEVDSAHRAFAASLRSSSPIEPIRRESYSDQQRQTPRSSVSSTKTFRRDMREGSHDSTAPSETSRISSSTVTRQSPSKSVGKSVITKQTVVKTKNVNGSNETISSTPTRSTKSPSPGKTVTTNITTVTTTRKSPTTEVPKADNQITKPAEILYPINDPLTITKTHYSSNDASFPVNEVVEEPCIKKHFYKVGPSDITPQMSDGPAIVKSFAQNELSKSISNNDNKKNQTHIIDHPPTSLHTPLKLEESSEKVLPKSKISTTPNEDTNNKHVTSLDNQENQDVHEKSPHSPAPSRHTVRTHPKSQSPIRDGDFNNYEEPHYEPSSSSGPKVNDHNKKPQINNPHIIRHSKEPSVESRTVVRESTFKNSEETYPTNKQIIDDCDEPCDTSDIESIEINMTKPQKNIRSSVETTTKTSTISHSKPKTTKDHDKPVERNSNTLTEGERVDNLFKTTQKSKTKENVNEEFLKTERINIQPSDDETLDGGYVSKITTESTPISPTFKKKGLSRRETFEERCRQNLGMEDNGDTQGNYKNSPESEVESDDSQPIKKPSKTIIQDTKFEVKIEDCDEDDEPLYISNVKDTLKTRNDISTPQTTEYMSNSRTEQEVNKKSVTNITQNDKYKNKKETKFEPSELYPGNKPDSQTETDFDNESEIDTEQENFISKKVITCNDETFVEKFTRTPSPESKRKLPKDGTRSKQPSNVSPTNNPNNDRPEPTPTRLVGVTKPSGRSPNTKEKPSLPSKTTTKPIANAVIDTNVSTTEQQRILRASPTSTVKTTAKHTIQSKKDFIPKTVRKDSDILKKPIKEYPTSTIQTRSKTSPNKERNITTRDDVEAESSPDTSPTRFTERRRSSNISVHTEIIIDHTSPKSPKQNEPKSKNKSHSPMQPTEKELINNTVQDKPTRKLPVTDRKESAPVHRVTRRDKDSKMSRSTSENVMKISGKTNKKPEMSSLSPSLATKPDRRSPKCFTTKTINLSKMDNLINSEDMESIIIDIQQAKSSREPSPDKIIPTPVPIGLDTGKPRYPDVVQEPEDELRKKPVVKNVPIFEEESNEYVSCHISEINVDKSMKSTDFIDYNDEILDNPTIEAPLSLDYPSINRPDEECLLSVHEKVSKFTHTAEEVKKPKASSPFNREFDETPKVPENDDCLLTVDQKVNKFLKTAESITKTPISPAREIERPNFDDMDEDLRQDECNLSVSEKVNKFIDTADKLAPTMPQKSPELVARIERHISRQSEPEYQEPETDDEPSIPFSENHTTEIEIKRQKDILLRPSVWEKTKQQKTETSKYTDDTFVEDISSENVSKSNRKTITTVIDDEELVPMTKSHTTAIELKRQKDILSRQSVFDRTKQPMPKKSNGLNSAPTPLTNDYNKKPQTKKPNESISNENTMKKVYNSSLVSTTRSVFETPEEIKKTPKRKPLDEPINTTNTKPEKTHRHSIIQRKPSEAGKEPHDTESEDIEYQNSDTETEVTLTSHRKHSTKTTQNSITDERSKSVSKPKVSSNRNKSPEKLSKPEVSHSPTSTPNTCTTKKTVTKITERTLKHTQPSNISDNELVEPILERPKHEKPTVILTERSRIVPESVAARRNIFESGVTAKPTKPSSPVQTGRRPSYMDHTKSSLEHTRRDSLEINKTNYSRKSSLEEENVYEMRPNTAVKFDVPHKSPNTPSISEDIDIENIFDLEILEEMLETVTSYEIRRRIRAQIRLVKKNMINMPLDDKKKTGFKKSTIINSTQKTSTSSSNVKHEETDGFDEVITIREGKYTKTPRDRSHSPDAKTISSTLKEVHTVAAPQKMPKSSSVMDQVQTDITTKVNYTTKPQDRSHSTKRISQKIQSEETVTSQKGKYTKIPHDRSQSPEVKTVQGHRPGSYTTMKHFKTEEIENDITTNRKYTTKESDVSRSPSRSPSRPSNRVHREEISTDRCTKTSRDRSHSPHAKTISSTLKEVRSVTEHQPTTKRTSRTEQVSYSSETKDTRKSERKQSHENTFKSSSSPDYKPVSKPGSTKPISTNHPEYKTKSHLSKSTDQKDNSQSNVINQHESKTSVVTKTSYRNAQSPESKHSGNRVDNNKTPIWTDRKNVLKNQSNSPITTRKVSTLPTTRTSTSKVVKSSSQRQSKTREEDSITSSYGIGPTDENGLPLFGIRALKQKKQAQPCETTEEVTGYVVEEKFYSDNKTKPIVERKELIYSTNAEELQKIKRQVDNRKTSNDDGVVRRFKKIDKEQLQTDPKAIDDFSATSTKYVRRGSVKEMSEKFIRKESSQSVTEKSSSTYPKAGLILLTNSRKGSMDSGEDCFELSTESYTKPAREVSHKYRSDEENEGECEYEMKHSSHKVTESESDCESLNIQRETSKKSSSSTRSFLNSSSESKLVTSVDDVLERMRNADNVTEECDTAEDQEARALLNKFIGASVIMSGVETVLPTKQTRTITTYANNDGDNLRNKEVKTTRITKTIKSGSSSSPVTVRTTCDIEEIWDEEILKELLEQASTYEERRKIRARLRELMAEREEQQHSTSTTEKTETKEKDGAVVTTTTKVTTRTVSGTAPKPVSPFAKFRQMDKQISQQSPKSPSTPTTPGGGTATPSGSAPIFKFTDPALNARAATVKDQLLQWCQIKTKEYENVQITNFSGSWVDGLAFCALIHHFLPDAFDYSQLTPQSRRHNFELAFTVADEKAGIAPLLDVEDMVVMKRPDWKCVFVYVQSIYRRFRNCQ